METFKIIEINGCDYKLKKEKEDATIHLLFEFYNVKPQVGDFIVLPKVLLDKNSEEYAQPYAFEPNLDEEVLNKFEVAGVIINGKKILLKRVFG